MARYCSRVHNTYIFWVLVVLIGICLVTGAQAQRAILALNSNDAVTTDTDLLVRGHYLLQHTYSISAYNMDDDGDTVLGNITLVLDLQDTSHIVKIRESDYATVNESAVQWVFPGDFTVPENESVDVGIETDYYDQQYVPVTLQRRLNSTRFTSDGYQMANFSITIENFSYATRDLPCTLISGGIIGRQSSKVNASFVPDTLTTDLPFSALSQPDIYRICFGLNPTQLEKDRTYTIGTVMKIDLPDEAANTLEYRPFFGIYMSNRNSSFDAGPTYSAVMPKELLPPDVTYVIASTNVSNSWWYSTSYSKFVSLSQVSKHPKDAPAANFTANFTANTTSGPAPLTVQFTDTGTIENPAAWRWDFGNGFLSKVRNPLFTYHGAGAYNVSLTVTDAENRTWTALQENYIAVT